MDMGTKSYSRKQAGVIYRAVKEGKLTMSREAISAMYDNADYCEVYSNRTAEIAQHGIPAIKNAVDFIFSNDYESAQTSINHFEQVAA